MKKIDTKNKEKHGYSKKYILISSLTLLVSAVMLIFGTIAWFSAKVINGGAENAVLDTSGETLEAKLYAGKDKEHDGVLDNADTYQDSSRTEKLANLYDEETDDLSFSGCLPGNVFTYKMVVTNPNTYSVTAQLSLSDLSEYFKETYPKLTVDGNGNITGYADGYTAENLADTEGANSARIMFKVSGISVSEYEGENYNTKTSSVYGEVADQPLWTVSEGQSFVTAKVGAGKLVEIDFSIECMQLADVVSGYRSFCEQMITDNNYTGTEVAKQITALCESEITYVTEINVNEESSRLLEFTIKHISLRGEQNAG